MMQQELAPLLLPEPDDPKALRFDALLYGMELAHLAGLPYNRAHHDLLKKAEALSKIANVPRHNRHCWRKYCIPIMWKIREWMNWRKSAKPCVI